MHEWIGAQSDRFIGLSRWFRLFAWPDRRNFGRRGGTEELVRLCVTAAVGKVRRNLQNSMQSVLISAVIVLEWRPETE